jgi:hypothetical protein
MLMIDSTNGPEMTSVDQDDPLIDELVTEALKDFQGVVPPEVMQAIRDNIADALAATSTGRRLLRQVRPDPTVNKSADVEKFPGESSGREGTGTEGGGSKK